MKQLLLTMTFVLTCLSSQAQQFNFYALAGPVLSQIDGDRIGGYNKLGLEANIGIAYPINEKWQTQMELGYISKGKGSYNSSSGASYKTNLNYIQLPVLANYLLTNKISLESGLSFGFLFSYQFYEDGSPTSGETFSPSWFDLDWLLGATYTLNQHWKSNLRFSYSIFHMNEISDTNYYRPNIWKHPLGMYNRNLALAFQYWF